MQIQAKSIIGALSLVLIWNVESAMANEKQDLSMFLNEVAGIELATEPIALALAEMLFRHVYGDDDFETQLPLKVTDQGDRWLIVGSRDPAAYPVHELEPAPGEVEMVILKANCKVVRFTQKAYLPLVEQ
ncbi:NTF2 fold immunity protein [Rhodobiaceae bacterium]|nr:NTF2 fold immunity protein [Rhodobiaceae bacterium]